MPQLCSIGAASARGFGLTEEAGGSVLSDDQFNLTTLLLPGNGTNGAQNNTFLDSSTNNFTVTRNGNTTQGTFSPFSQTGWSNYFDGTGDYLTLSSNTSMDFGTGNFTIEGWFYTGSKDTSVGASRTIIGNSGNGYTMQLYIATSGYLTFGNTGSTFIQGSTDLANNAWHHFAIARKGTGTNEIAMWVDGVRVAQGTNSQNYTSGTIFLGSFDASNGFWNGYLSNLRIVKGTAVYDASNSTITVPTSPLTAITNTSLLTCQSNRFVDNSANAFALTVNGNVSVQPFSPFNPTAAYSAATVGGSAYFDGTGDYLTAPYNSAWDFGTGDFTIESWVYRTALGSVVIAASFTNSGNDGWSFEINSSNQITFYAESAFVATSTATIPANTWTHVAVSRSGTTLRLFIDGAVATTVTYSTSIAGFSGLLAISATATGVAPFVGYQSNFRVVKGTAVYTSAFVPPTAPLTNITNTGFLLSCTNAGITDATAKNVLETVGNAQISTAQSKFGGSSMYFDGTGDYLLPPPSQNFAFRTGDFTIELWIKTSSTGDDGILQISTTAGGFSTSYTNGLMLTSYLGTLYWALDSSSVNTSTTINDGNWHHIAMTRSGSTVRVFKNGTQISTATRAGDVTATNLVVGGYYQTAYTLDGYINDLRFTKGYARYTANFTPPTAAFPLL